MNWSILVSTFERPDSLAQTLETLRESWPNVFITVGDQSSTRFVDICNSFYAENVEMPYDCGLSACQNRLVAAAKTEWIVLIDDDILIDKGLCDPEVLFAGVDRWDLVAAGPELRQVPIKRKRQWHGMMEIEDGYIRRVIGDAHWKIGGGWRRTDFLPPGVLFGRAKSLAENPFNEKLKLSQGLEWCWRIRNKEPGSLGLCLRQKVTHMQNFGTPAYKTLRERGPNHFQKLSFEIMGIKGHNGSIRRSEI